MKHNYKVVNFAKCKICGERDFFSEVCRDTGCSQSQTRVRECSCARRHRKHIAKTMRSR